MEHMIGKYIIVTDLVEFISRHQHVSYAEARDFIFTSNLIDLIEDDETGLYGESPLHVYYIYEDKIKEAFAKKKSANHE